MIGYLRVIRDFLPLIPRDGSGRIINITGAAGISVWAPALTHGLNNAALNHGTGYLAQDSRRREHHRQHLTPAIRSSGGESAA